MGFRGYNRLNMDYTPRIRSVPAHPSRISVGFEWFKVWQWLGQPVPSDFGLTVIRE